MADKSRPQSTDTPEDLDRMDDEGASRRRPTPRPRSPTRSSSFARSATRCTTDCCARRQSSITIASASIASARTRPSTPQWSFLQDLLPIIDDFERALQADAPGAESYRQGLEIIHRALMDMLRKRGVTPIEAVGTMFDPQVHQAVVVRGSIRQRRDGEVIEEFRRGYRLGDRLLRPAMVKVAKA